jgi:tRNA (guanine37-N1)-methyltransferase
MFIGVLTIFPGMFDSFWGHGIVRRAVESGIIQVQAIDVRSHAQGKHQATDDRPFGGGSGMIMKPEPLAGAIREAAYRCPGAVRILLSPQGRVFDQQSARELAGKDGLIFVCGRYEGVDERITQLIDIELSAGDFVLSGGEIAAMLIMDAVVRLLPGALGGDDAAEKDSFSSGLLEHAQYTRPRRFEGDDVPGVLLSGDHGAIDRWRRENALIRTLLKRPDLIAETPMSADDVEVLQEWSRTIERLLQAQNLRGPGAPSGHQQER